MSKGLHIISFGHGMESFYNEFHPLSGGFLWFLLSPWICRHIQANCIGVINPGLLASASCLTKSSWIANTAPILGLCPLPIENIEEVILIPVVGLTLHSKPCSIMEAILDVSLLLIGLWETERFFKICKVLYKKIHRILKKKISDFLGKKNYWLGKKIALMLL